MNEATILRTIGVLALVSAFVVTAAITINSGILGGDDSNGEVDVIDSAVTPEEGEAVETEDPAAADPEAAPAEADAEAVDDSVPITLETETYVVEGGDSFFSIASRYNTSIDELFRLNPSVNPQNLKPGTEIVVPKVEE